MSKRPRRQKNTPSSAELQRLVEAEVARRLQRAALPQGAYPLNQDALFAQMTANQAPAKQGTPMFAPGAPLVPSPGLVLDSGPRTFTYPVGYNISSRPRSTESTSFEVLRNLASLYDGIQLCEQVWLDTVSKLNLVVKPRPEIVAEQGQSASNQKYAEKIRKYTDILSYPDKYNGYDLKTWLRAAVRDQLQIDAVCIYIRKNRAGGVFSLELVDGTLIKPLIDPRGRRPQPPYPAYQQFYYGVPDGWYTSNEMIYLRETPRTESIYGLSRVERIIMRVNQALRKQNKDLTKFTDGNIPPGILEPPAEAGEQWTPEQLASYQMMWDAMLSGNDQTRSRVKVVAPGSVYTPIAEPDIYLDFDRFLMNVTTACYSMTMADLGFTENVNKSSGDSQENVFYRRAVQPLMERYAQLFTQILRDYFGEQDLIVAWGGFEEQEDFNLKAASFVALVQAGIVSPTIASQQLNLPWSGPEIPNFLATKEGPVFLEDAADPGMRQAANDAKRAGYELAKNPPPAPEPGQATDKPNGVGVPGKAQDDDAKATKGNEKPQEDEENEEETKPAGPTKPPVRRQDDPDDFFGVATQRRGDPQAKRSWPWRLS